MTDSGIDRREFIKGAAATMALLLTAEGLTSADVVAANPPAPAPAGPPVKIGVIGLGAWGKGLVTTLAKIPNVQVTAICDTYEAYVTRASKIATNAKTFSDYKQLLASPDVEAVIIATPTHQHKEIVLAAIQADKHVYLEAPIASSLDEAKAIAMAGQGSKKIFQVGLQGRANPLYEHVSKFVKSGCMGTPAEVHAQYNKKQSWKKLASSAERIKEINWQLHKATSLGLVGELGIHSIDLANWYLDAMPVAITGFCTTAMNWDDDRDVPDTVQCVIEYPKNVRMVFSSTIVSSFSGNYALFQGNQSSLMMREQAGWMIKEADSDLIGWEVYARKEQVYDETGICMVANATKIIKEGGEPGKEAPAADPTQEPLYAAMDSFAKSVRGGSKPAAGALEGYQAAVSVIKANEAILSGTKIALTPDMFELK